MVDNGDHLRSILGIIYGLGIICEGSSLTLSALSYFECLSVGPQGRWRIR